MNRRSRSAALLVLAVGLLAGRAEAADPEAYFDLQRFRPALGARDILAIESALMPKHLEWRVGAYANYSSKPLRFETSEGQSAVLVDSQTTLDLGATIGLFDRAEISLVLPITANFDANNREPGIGALSSLSTTTIPSLRITPKVQLLKAGDFLLGAAVPLEIPFAGGDFQESASVTANPELLAEYLTPRARLAVNAGMVFRKPTDFVNLTVGHALTYGAGAEILLLGEPKPVHRLSLLGALDGEVGVVDPAKNSRPLEMLGGLRWDLPENFAFTLAAGSGLIAGYGAPDLRVIGGISVAPSAPRPPPPPPPVVKKPLQALAAIDHSGKIKHGGTAKIPVLSGATGAPREELRLLATTRANGGTVEVLPDNTVLYRANPGFSGPDRFAYRIGTPDGRTATGNVNVTVMEPPPPPKDTDGDGLPDESDRCPLEPETYNGFEDQDGCPDKAPRGMPTPTEKAMVVGKKIVILDQVHFATNKDRILPKSYPLLNAVAKVLREHPEITRLRIEGHTDSVGKPDANLDLSRRRAASVRKFLIDAGIDPARLESEGFGMTQPIAPNTTTKNRALNRRVAFTVLD